VLDEHGEYRLVGDPSVRRSDFRLIAATRDASTLAPDLLSRFGVRVVVPSLRERREDVPFLLNSLFFGSAAPSVAARRLVRDVAGRPVLQMTPAFVDGLVRYPYKRNLRDLARLLSAALMQARRDVLAPPTELLDAHAEARASQVTGAFRAVDGEVEPLEQSAEVPQVHRTADEVRAALTREAGNVSRAAKALGVSRQTLARLMEKYRMRTR
jgi:DNA-binding NtrC family response regulator